MTLSLKLRFLIHKIVLSTILKQNMKVDLHYVPEWKFWLGFCQRGNTTHIHDFCIPLDFLGIKDPQKNKKGQNFFQRPQTRPQLHLLKFCNFFALCGPFWRKNSADCSDLSLKAIKAKKANIRPNDTKLDFRIFRGLAMVSQHAKRTYKVPWGPIGIRFWETTTPEPKTGPAGQKISSDKELIKIKVEGS